MNVRAIFGARATPSELPPRGVASVVVSWAVRQGRAYMTVGGGQTFHVRAPLHLVEVEEIEPGRGVLTIDNPTGERQRVHVTVVGVAISDPMTADDQHEVRLIEKWLDMEAT